MSLTLPTTTGHMTDEMAEDMLGLNSELSDIAKTIEEIGNITHSEATNSTTQHSASGKEEFDTAAAAAVSKIIKDKKGETLTLSSPYLYSTTPHSSLYHLSPAGDVGRRT